MTLTNQTDTVYAILIEHVFICDVIKAGKVDPRAEQWTSEMMMSLDLAWYKKIQVKKN